MRCNRRIKDMSSTVEHETPELTLIRSLAAMENPDATAIRSNQKSTMSTKAPDKRSTAEHTILQISRLILRPKSLEESLKWPSVCRCR